MSIENDLSLIQDFDKNYYLQVFNPLPVAFVKGKGCYLTDTQGTKYIDMIGGIAVKIRARLQTLQEQLCRQGLLLQFRS